MSSLQKVLKSSSIKRKSAIILEDEEIKLIQKELLKMLDDMINVFDELDIDYQLSGGTALGGVRHKGFIPWDDDIDINLKRSDVGKFANRFLEKYGDKYWIHIPSKTPGYDSLIMRVISKDVRARVFLDSEKEECGLMIDIFILENTFNNPILRRIHGIGCMGFRYILSCIRFKRVANEMNEIIDKEDVLRKYLKKRALLGNVFSLLPLSFWANIANKWITICKNENSKYVVITSGTHQFFDEMYYRENFCKIETCTFEGRKVKISSDYDIYLTKLYGGNYMEIPPKEKREKHMLVELDREALYKRNV